MEDMQHSSLLAECKKLLRLLFRIEKLRLRGRVARKSFRTAYLLDGDPSESGVSAFIPG
jgi:hypothetical protein